MIDDPRRLLALALVGVVAVALVSATITSTVDRSGVAVEGGLNVTDAPDEVWSAPPGLYGGSGARSDDLCLAGTDLGLLAGSIAAALVGATAVVYRRYDGLAAVGVLGMGVPIVVLTVAIATACGAGDFSALPGNGDTLGFGASAATLSQVLAAMPTWLLVLLGTLAAAAAVVATGDRADVRALLRRLDNPALDPEETDDEDAAVAVGRVAGEAADRIETGVDADNEVFRAWRAMTDHLDVDRPRSSTPAEFADAAVDAGLGRDSVEELTELFEAVRYGGQAPTDERERRAVAALRSVERDAGGESP